MPLICPGRGIEKVKKDQVVLEPEAPVKRLGGRPKLMSSICESRVVRCYDHFLQLLQLLLMLQPQTILKYGCISLIDINGRDIYLNKTFFKMRYTLKTLISIIYRCICGFKTFLMLNSVFLNSPK